MEDVRTVLAALRRFAVLTPSWPRRVRWLVNCQSLADAGFGIAYTPMDRFDLREVVLTSIERRAGVLTIAVVEVGRPRRDELVFVVATPPTADVVLALDEWRQLRTPLVLVLHRGGAALECPTAVVTDLHRIDNRQLTRAPRHSRSANGGTP